MCAYVCLGRMRQERDSQIKERERWGKKRKEEGRKGSRNKR